MTEITSDSGPGRLQDVEQDISPVALANVVLRHPRLVMGTPLLFGVLGIAYVLSRSAEYAASSRFIPEGRPGTSSQLTGLAAQFGVSVGDIGTGVPLDFYARLLTTRDVLRQVAISQYRVIAGQDTLAGTIADVYRLKATTEEGRIQRAMNLLRSQISAGVDLKAGTVGLTVRSRWPALAEQVNSRLLDQVNQYNLQKRQSLATAERQFMESRLAQSLQELASAEAELERFMEQNRGYENSSRLAFAAARLRRRVDLRQQVYLTLAQAYEQARIGEVRNTPVITVVEGPERSARPTGDGLARILFMSFVVGGMLGAGLSFGREYIERQRRRRPDDWAEFELLGRQSAAKLARLWGRISATSRRTSSAG